MLRHWAPVFLDNLRRTGCVSTAAQITGKSRSTVYRHMSTKPEFRRLCDEALESYHQGRRQASKRS